MDAWQGFLLAYRGTILPGQVSPANYSGARVEFVFMFLFVIS